MPLEYGVPGTSTGQGPAVATWLLLLLLRAAAFACALPGNRQQLLTPSSTNVNSLVTSKAARHIPIRPQQVVAHV
jgi:hypothetical protein